MRNPLMIPLLAVALLTASLTAHSAPPPPAQCAKAFVKADDTARKTVDKAALKVCGGSAQAADLADKVASKINKANAKANAKINELGTDVCDPDIQGQLQLDEEIDGEAAITARHGLLCNDACDSGDCDIPEPYLEASFLIDGAQEVPAVTTTATGAGTVTLDTVANTLTFDVSYTNLMNETMAHIHGFAAAGAEAGILFNLPLGTPKVGSVNYTEAQEDDIIAGLTYVNIHTVANSGGEIRGQVQPFATCP